MEPAASQNPTEPEKKEPNIRTMKSDVSEFLASTKPSLIQMLTSQVEAERAPQEEYPKTASFMKTLGLLGILLALGAGGYLGYRYFQPSEPGEAGTLIPQPFFSVDKSVTIEYRGPAANLAGKIAENSRLAERQGTLKRLVVLGTSGDKSKAFQLNTEDFLKAAAIEMPPGISAALSNPTMPVYYWGKSGSRLALIIKTSDPERALEALLRGESGLAGQWANLFLGEMPTVRIVPFEDRVYKNINYRILPLDAERDLQIVYGIFAAKNYLIITTSEEAFKIILNRLFQAS